MFWLLAGVLSASAGLPFDALCPVIYDNDDPRDMYTDEYIMALASAGTIDLRGIITTSSHAPYNRWVTEEDFEQFLRIRREIWQGALRSGLRKIPEPVAGVKGNLVRPDSGEPGETVAAKSAGGYLIRYEARKASPERPLVVIVGGTLSTAVDAYLMDPSIAANMVVLFMDFSGSDELVDGYNAWGDGWAAVIAMRELRMVRYRSMDEGLMDFSPEVSRERMRNDLQPSPMREGMLVKQHPTNSLPGGRDVDCLAAIHLVRSDYASGMRRQRFSEPVDSDGHQVPMLRDDPEGNILTFTSLDKTVATEQWWRVMTDPEAVNSTRRTIPLNGDWAFIPDPHSGGEAEGWAANGLPHEGKRWVRVPHTWNCDEGLETYWGTGWYERWVEILPDEWRRTAHLRFDAVNHDAVVFINGEKAGEHLGSGYNRFFINVTPHLKPGRNRITVKVDNAPSRNNLPFLKSFDWASDGGIIRGVLLSLTNPVSIKSVHVTAKPCMGAGCTEIRLSLWEIPDFPVSDMHFHATVTEENQKTRNRVFSGSMKGRFEEGRFHGSLTLPDIRLWHFDSPNLYKLRVRMYHGDRLLDETEVTFGYRSIQLSKGGLLLNGEPVRLMGVEWMPGSGMERGMAESLQDTTRALTLMKEANCIFTRFHWQQDEAVLDWCDRNGLLVQEEIPAWGWETLLDESLLQKGFQHLDEMIDDHYNHPSIISWGLGNEIASRSATNIDAVKRLYARARERDPDRLATYVSNALYRSNETVQLPDASAEGDMLMFNEYFSTWYGSGMDSVSDELDWIAEKYPGKLMTISEWGLCEPKFPGGDARRAREMVEQIGIYGTKPYIVGAIYFSLNDYRTHMGEDFTFQYPQRVHGVCDINLNPKPSYEVLKQISSPLVVQKAERENGTVTIIIRGKDALPSYTLRDYVLRIGEAELKIRELRPGETREFSIQSSATEYSIYRPTGFPVHRGIIQEGLGSTGG